MKKIIFILALSFTGIGWLSAQDSTKMAKSVSKKSSYVKNTFAGDHIIDNQTVVVPNQGAFQFDVQHRFGTIEKGWKDLAGLFASANMLIGVSYVPVKDLQIGFGATNDKMQTIGSIKYALFKQTKDNKMPVSVTLYGNAVMDTRAKNASLPIVEFSDRFSYYSQIIIARKITEKLSLQVAPTLSYYNNVEAFYNANNVITAKTNNAHLSISAAGRYTLSPTIDVIANYEQPLTEHPMNNPNPNIALGLDFKTSGHEFQVFLGNYGTLIPQQNSVYNHNDFQKSQFCVGFNISRLWFF